MSRTTISQQLHEAQSTIKDQLRALENRQQEIFQLREVAGRTAAEHLATQHTAVAATRDEMQAIITDLEKKLKAREDSAGYQTSRMQLVENEIEQAHAVLDGVEGAPERSYKKNDDYGGTVQRNVVTRLAGAFLAIARNSGQVRA